MAKSRSITRIACITGSVLALFAALISIDALAASTSTDMRQKVIQRISITAKSGLDFGVASPGDNSKTIAPDRRENPYNASFLVRGETNYSYCIHLPPDGAVEMTVHGGLQRDRIIPVNGFKSFPENFGNLGPSGSDTLFVGATRSALTQNQHPGDYVGYFTVTVVY
jgi:hypothetical protein